MTEYLIDTNLLLRFFVGDVPKQADIAEKWFREARDGEKKLVLKPLVVAEVCYVLELFYKRSRREISEKLETFLAQKWIVVDDRESLLALWSWYVSGFHFVDSYLLANSKLGKRKILTFDKKLAREV